MQCTAMYVTSLLWTDQCYVVLPILYTVICDTGSMAGINSSMAVTWYSHVQNDIGELMMLCKKWHTEAGAQCVHGYSYRHHSTKEKKSTRQKREKSRKQKCASIIFAILSYSCGITIKL